MHNSEIDESLGSIAVIGMSGRFPGARSIDEFWQHLQHARELIDFSDEESQAEGSRRDPLRGERYVKAKPVLDDVELFDPSFFGMSSREASLMDPQHRLLTMCAHEALEDAGYDPATYPGLIGIYCGKGESHYLTRNVLPQEGDEVLENSHQCRILNNKDFLVSFISSKLDLRGPSVNVQAADSTSLVAISLACQSLLNYQCDMALCGGVSISLPPGTVSGGVGIVVLKRTAEALTDGDCVHAVIKGTAINHDGSGKDASRRIDGQAEVIGMAQALAGVAPETVTYIEASGVAAPLWDAREIAALTNVFRASTQKNSFCGLGSAKTDIGDLYAAAGVASLIKTVLALKHKMIPPSLPYNNPSSEIDFVSSPFYVNSRLSEWRSNGVPRRAGVSSFGTGGVNAHVVLEEAPARMPSSHSRPWQLLVLSGKSEEALERATNNLVAHLKEHPEQNLADLAYTLQTGRKSFAHRRVLVCRDPADGLAVLETRNPRRVFTSVAPVSPRSVAFMFSGLGNHYVYMAHDLYQTETVFRQTVEHCCELLKPHLGLDLREVLYPARKESSPISPPAGLADGMDAGGIDLRKMLRRGELAGEEAADRLNQSLFSQPALFVVEYALAQLWMSWGIYPDAMIGYSIGEYVAACIAEVFSLEEALLLVARRARMIQGLPGGAMLAVPLSEEQVQPLLNQRLTLSASNGPDISVVGGPTEAVTELQRRLTEQGLACQRLQVVHAFHSKMMSPIVESFTEMTRGLKLNPPKTPYLSSVTGDWITAEQAQDPKYWGEHLCQPVRFADGVQELWRQPGRMLLEVGPGQSLCAWAMQQPENVGAVQRVALPSLRHSYEQQSDAAYLLQTLGRLWLAGVPIDWSGFYALERRHRISLPTYPFDLQRCWIDPQKPLSGFRTLASSDTRPDGDEEEKMKELDQTGSRRFLPTPYVAARNGLEEQLSQVWHQVLNADQIGIYDNFFALGGDSIKATQLLTRVKGAFQATLSLRDFFNSPTVADLAMMVVQSQAERADSEVLAQVLREIKQLSQNDAPTMPPADGLAE